MTLPSGRRPAAPIAARLLLLFISLVLMLAVLEIGLRLTYHDMWAAVPVNTWDPVMGTRQMPNSRGFVQTPFYRTDLVINSKGLRDREFDYPKPGRTRRILCLGDSFTCGYGVPADQTFAKRLERALNSPAGSADSLKWEVLNAGVGSTGTAHQLAYLNAEGFRYRPDIVVLCFFPANDFWDNTFSGLYTIQGDTLVKHDAPITEARRIQTVARHIPGYRTLMAHSYLFNFIKGKLGNMHWRELGKMADQRAGGEDTNRNQDDLTRHLVVAMADACRHHAAQFVVMCISPVARDSARTAEVEHAALDHGIAWLDLTPVDRAAAGQNIKITYPEGHWNATGHAMVAEKLEEYLKSSGMLAAVR